MSDGDYSPRRSRPVMTLGLLLVLETEAFRSLALAAVTDWRSRQFQSGGGVIVGPRRIDAGASLETHIEVFPYHNSHWFYALPVSTLFHAAKENLYSHWTLLVMRRFRRQGAHVNQHLPQKLAYTLVYSLSDAEFTILGWVQKSAR